MIPEVSEGTWIGGYTLDLCFTDGTEVDVNLEKELYGTVFEALREPAVFREFYVDPELHTVAWPNGADFTPEFLYERIQIAA